MADGGPTDDTTAHAGSAVGGPDQPAAGRTVELRISVTGTHTRRSDLEALNTWLAKAPSLKEARERHEVRVTRKDSLDQSDAMAGELLQDVILVVTAEAVRPVAESAWSSVLTWLRNRRRLADADESPRVVLDGGRDGGRDGDGPDGLILLDTRETGRGAGPDARPESGPASGVGYGTHSGGRPGASGSDEPGEA